MGQGNQGRDRSIAAGHDDRPRGIPNSHEPDRRRPAAQYLAELPGQSEFSLLGGALVSGRRIVRDVGFDRARAADHVNEARQSASRVGAGRTRTGRCRRRLRSARTDTGRHRVCPNRAYGLWRVRNFPATGLQPAPGIAGSDRPDPRTVVYSPLRGLPGDPDQLEDVAEISLGLVSGAATKTTEFLNISARLPVTSWYNPR